ncbi:MAG: hypothetical protein KAG84_01325 [Bacteroidales bacterium]|nr:hypothetical protein [Bacteroidales bacterium]
MWGKKDKEGKSTKNSPRLETEEGTKAPKKSLKIKVPAVKIGFLRGIVSIIDGSFLTSKTISRNLPYILFLIALAFLYVANNYNAQSKAHKIETIKKELKDLRDEHISIKSDLMFRTKKSEVANQLKGRGIKEATKPPYKIFIKKEDIK